jgi:hypothetical protein
MYQPSSTSVSSVASTVSTTSSTSTVHHHKRGRQGSEASSTSGLPYHNYQQPQQMQQQQYHLPSIGSNMNPLMVQVVQYPSVTTSQKQGDDGDEVSYDSSVTPKKARPSNYRPPRFVRSNLLTAMGTLASPNRGTTTTTSPLNHHYTNTPAPTHVPMRRQLSGGHLEEFLGNHTNSDTSPTNGMDTFADCNRPRSMSF